MNIKKQSRTLQELGKEFGYDIKLTHAQEILSRLNGFENRHAALAETTRYFRVNQCLFSAEVGTKKLSHLAIINLAAEQGYPYIEEINSYQEITEEDFNWLQLADRYVLLKDYLRGIKPTEPDYNHKTNSWGELEGKFYYCIKLKDGEVILFSTEDFYMDSGNWIHNIAVKRGLIANCEYSEIKYAFAISEENFKNLLKKYPQKVSN